MRQLIIARKDLEMSPGKLAAQVAHASIAFISRTIRDSEGQVSGPTTFFNIGIPTDIVDGWFRDRFTKTVCSARNFNQMMRAERIAEELGLQKDIDFFEIWDACLTELTPEVVDEDGVGRTLTCIGFKPLPDDVAHAISKKFQLY